MISGDLSLTVTFFTEREARSKRQRQISLDELAEQIRNARAPAKDLLPWLKCATFGDLPTHKGSLRWDGNVRTISGVEADYDGEQLGFDDAGEIAEKAGLLCLIYTSPSHRPEAPRWRILCPTSTELRPVERAHMVSRLNGLYRGIFAAESWALSQSYYFGRVNGNQDHQAVVVEGMPIDQLHELDRSAIGKPATATINGNGVDHAAGGPVDEGTLIEQIRTGKSYHPACTRLLGLWAIRGVSFMEARGRLVEARGG